jgi:hypothetical protein
VPMRSATCSVLYVQRCRSRYMFRDRITACQPIAIAYHEHMPCWAGLRPGLQSLRRQNLPSSWRMLC